MQITRYRPGALPGLRACAGPESGLAASLIGAPAILGRRPLALFCSVQCPGDVILKSYDLARILRGRPVTLIGGFQAPIEKEFLELFLRRPPSRAGRAASASPSVIVCPARGLGKMRIPRAWRGPLEEGRLLILSTFPDSLRRPNAASAARRNACVAALADRVLFLHAAEGGKTEALCRRLLAAARPVYTLASPHNAHLVALGARAVSPEEAALPASPL